MIISYALFSLPAEILINMIIVENVYNENSSDGRNYGILQLVQ